MSSSPLQHGKNLPFFFQLEEGRIYMYNKCILVLYVYILGCFPQQSGKALDPKLGAPIGCLHLGTSHHKTCLPVFNLGSRFETQKNSESWEIYQVIEFWWCDLQCYRGTNQIEIASCKLYDFYNYLEPVCPLFWGFNPPKQGLFQSKQGSFGFQVGIWQVTLVIPKTSSC